MWFEMKTILFTISTMSLFIFSYLSGMVMMADKKVCLSDLSKTYVIFKGNGKLFVIFYTISLVSTVLICYSTWKL